MSFQIHQSVNLNLDHLNHKHLNFHSNYGLLNLLSNYLIFTINQYQDFEHQKYFIKIKQSYSLNSIILGSNVYMHMSNQIRLIKSQ